MMSASRIHPKSIGSCSAGGMYVYNEFLEFHRQGQPTAMFISFYPCPSDQDRTGCVDVVCWPVGWTKND